MIYFLATESEPTLFKVGFTSGNVFKRMKSIQTGCPYKLSVYATVNGNQSTEREIHQRFNDYKLNGEWFRLPKSSLDILLSEYGYKGHHDNWKMIYNDKDKAIAAIRNSDNVVYAALEQYPPVVKLIYAYTSRYPVISFHGEGLFVDLREVEQDCPSLKDHFAKFRKRILGLECEPTIKTALAPTQHDLESLGLDKVEEV